MPRCKCCTSVPCTLNSTSNSYIARCRARSCEGRKQPVRQARGMMHLCIDCEACHAGRHRVARQAPCFTHRRPLLWWDKRDMRQLPSACFTPAYRLHSCMRKQLRQMFTQHTALLSFLAITTLTIACRCTMSLRLLLTLKGEHRSSAVCVRGALQLC